MLKHLNGATQYFQGVIPLSDGKQDEFINLHNSPSV